MIMKPFKILLRATYGLILLLSVTTLPLLSAELGAENPNAWWRTDESWPKSFWVGVPLVNNSIASVIQTIRETVATEIAKIKDNKLTPQQQISWDKLTYPHITFAEGSIKDKDGAERLLSILKRINWIAISNASISSNLQLIGQPLLKDPKAGRRWFTLNMSELFNTSLYTLARTVKKALLDEQKRSNNSFDVKLYGLPEDALQLHISLIRINPAYDDPNTSQYQKQRLDTIVNNANFNVPNFAINTYKLVITPAQFAGIKKVSDKQIETNKPMYTAAQWQSSGTKYAPAQPSLPVTQPSVPVVQPTQQPDSAQIELWQKKMYAAGNSNLEQFFNDNKTLAFPIVTALIQNLTKYLDKERMQVLFRSSLNTLHFNLIYALINAGFATQYSLLELAQSNAVRNLDLQQQNNREQLKKIIIKLLNANSSYNEAEQRLGKQIYFQDPKSKEILEIFEDAHNQWLSEKFGKLSTK